MKIKCLEFGSISLVHRLIDYPKARWKEEVNGLEVRGLCENVINMHIKLRQIKISSHFMKNNEEEAHNPPLLLKTQSIFHIKLRLHV